VTCVATLTADVVTVNVAELEPAGIVTPDGLVADVDELLESETSTPPEGAIPFRVTVAVAETPPITLAGFTLKDDTARVGGGFVCTPPPPPAQPNKRMPSEQKTKRSSRRGNTHSLVGQAVPHPQLQLPLRIPFNRKLLGEERTLRRVPKWGISQTIPGGSLLYNCCKCPVFSGLRRRNVVG
jgi:hypothetical protein